MGDETPRESADEVRVYRLELCGRCVRGEGGECHTPGCALWMNRAPDVPILSKVTALLPAANHQKEESADAR